MIIQLSSFLKVFQNWKIHPQLITSNLLRKLIQV